MRLLVNIYSFLEAQCPARGMYRSITGCSISYQFSHKVLHHVFVKFSHVRVGRMWTACIGWTKEHLRNILSRLLTELMLHGIFHQTIPICGKTYWQNLSLFFQNFFKCGNGDFTAEISAWRRHGLKSHFRTWEYVKEEEKENYQMTGTDALKSSEIFYVWCWENKYARVFRNVSNYDAVCPASKVQGYSYGQRRTFVDLKL